MQFRHDQDDCHKASARPSRRLEKKPGEPRADVERRGDAIAANTRVADPRPGDPSQVAKRVADVVGATVGLIVCMPLFAVVSVLILVTSGRPIFYSQERVGHRRRIFRILKFRSMRTDAEGTTGPIWATERDTRCTKVGDWLRRYNIDELPQLLNVLRGEMSLVGPRPERPVFVERFCSSMPDYDLRHDVPTGMTGWAQVHGWRGRTSLRKRLQYDLDYARRWTFWLDFRILFMTVQHVFWGKKCWAPAARVPAQRRRLYSQRPRRPRRAAAFE